MDDKLILALLVAIYRESRRAGAIAETALGLLAESWAEREGVSRSAMMKDLDKRVREAGEKRTKLVIELMKMAGYDLSRFADSEEEAFQALLEDLLRPRGDGE